MTEKMFETCKAASGHAAKISNGKSPKNAR
jgi:hypothetical protein